MQPGLDNQLLLVAAAGNDVDINAHPEGFPVNSGSDCLIFPACWSNDDPERGIISVVALNGDGTNLLKDQNGQIITNYGRVFDVSAVGAVATTMHGNFFGRAYGTSFAAPYVTGLASLIYAKAGYAHLNPTVTQVKNRILFSSDLEPPFLQFARFGRINFRTALRFQDNLIVYKPRANCPSPCEITANIARDTDEALVLTSGKKGNAHIAAGTLIPMKYVRRLALQDDGTFIIVFLEDGSLTKITNAQIRLQANRNIMTTTTGTEPFPLNDIKDYISCSVYPACELP
jgi:subtilisin family serine protease